ncbi:ABC-type transporter, integral membrane subunit [Crinalium epipsammum PCC 9333]|uniref:ABC-type transporter, integral membrane subunit n=1 Tax=Crinalium epipsammum PCC 9333 TaxID=1173022 RepID=K9VYM6_9CYAN|nr:metal ABC transporter permease [Crinalium epipsammum]AFZ12270.1 ABC-type transporter, integral membrane subunit [Crinalium epipsammum PCC 9333]
MLDWLIEPLNYEFIRNAMMMGILVGILCPIVGSYLIVQRMALLGDVIAHAVLPGLAIAFFLGIDILIGAFISGIFSTFVIAWIKSQSRVKVDAAMALTFSSFFSLGITLITLLKSKLDLENLLFGDILGVTITDVLRTGAIALIVLTFVKIFYKQLLFYTFDPLGAEAMGLPVNYLHLGLMAAITLTIVASMQSVGVVLVISLLVGPGITAYLLVKELHLMMILGAILGMITSISGVYSSYYLNIPSGPAIVLFSFGLFLLAILFSPSQGILTRPTSSNYYTQILRKLRNLI